MLRRRGGAFHQHKVLLLQAVRAPSVLTSLTVGKFSQVPRAAAMLLLAPGVSRAMASAQHTLGLSSQRQARPVPATHKLRMC